MGMYTECRGFLKINLGMDFKNWKEEFKAIKEIISSYNESERAEQCLSCTTITQGFNFTFYVFIGGEIKNYDNDWEKFLVFLKNNLRIESGLIETRYEEDDNYSTIYEKREVSKEE